MSNNNNSTMLMVDGLRVVVDHCVSSSGIAISGNVYPFANMFYSVKFEASAEICSYKNNGSPEVKSGVGFGGNTFLSEQAVLIVQASQIALRMASQYGEKFRALSVPKEAVSIISTYINYNNIAEIADSILSCISINEEIQNRGESTTPMVELANNKDFIELLNRCSISTEGASALMIAIAYRAGLDLDLADEKLEDEDDHNTNLNFNIRKEAVMELMGKLKKNK